MQEVPFDVWKAMLPLYLDPRDLSRLAGTCRKFRCFSEFVHIDYYLGFVDEALVRACYGGHQSLAQWLIDEKGATEFDWGLCSACYGGHQSLAQWLIEEKGATNVKDALRWAHDGGHKSLAQWLVDENGATLMWDYVKGRPDYSLSKRLKEMLG